MIRTKPLTGQCPRCATTAALAYHSRYTLRSGQTVLVWRCRTCRKTFCDRYGTAFYDLKTPEEKVQRALQQGLEGLCPEAVARVEGVHPTTVQRWVERAQQQAQAADQAVITNVTTENIELDELHSFAGSKHPDAQPEELDEVGQHWTHCALARESRLLLEVVVGPRTEETALDLVDGAAQRLAPDCWPVWSSDGWAAYWFALLVVFGVLIHFIKTKRRGRPKEPEVVPDPRLRYGQVVKERKGRRLVAVTKRVIFGVAELIPLQQISTSLLERLNGTLRQHVVPLHRKTRSFAKCRTALNTQTQFFKSYYNLCRKHGSLKGKTPAQAAHLTNHCWTLRELLTYNAAVISKIP
jgi:transposase-like protein/IS1 family transposase